MAPVAVVFAILDNGGSVSDLGFVLAAGVLATVACLLAGGVVADRFGRRAVMLWSDSLRFCAQGAFATLVLIGHPSMWALGALSAVLGGASGFFSPALTGLIPEILPGDDLQDANVFVGFANNVGSTLGPALAGVLVAATNAGVVLAIDALSFGASALSLGLVRLGPREAPGVSSMFDDLRDGWDAWRSRTWIWLSDIKFALFNVFVMAPFIVLGPVIAKESLGGAKSWGLILGAYGAGAIAGGFTIIGRKIRRPLLVITFVQMLWALPLVALAVVANTGVIAAAAFCAGIGSATFLTIWTTSLQLNVPKELLARVSSYDYFSSFAFGPIGLAIVGPIAIHVGKARILWFGVFWLVLGSLGLLAVGQIRQFRNPAARSIDEESA